MPTHDSILINEKMLQVNKLDLLSDLIRQGHAYLDVSVGTHALFIHVFLLNGASKIDQPHDSNLHPKILFTQW